MVTLQETAVKFNNNLHASHTGGRLSSDSGLLLVDELMDAFHFEDLIKQLITFKESGFHLARKSYTPQLKKNASLLLSDRKINTKSFDELSLHQSDELLKLQLENYREFHQEINSLSDKISFNRWKEMISIDLDREHSQVYVKEGTIEAYILCYESEDINSIEIGYIGGKDANKLEEYLTFYKQALSHLFTKFKIIEIEADDVDSFAYALLNEFEYETSESWDTYIYDKNIYSQL